MERLNKIKKLVVKGVLPNSQVIDSAYYSVVCAFPMSYSVGRNLIEFCREHKITPDESSILILGAFGGRDYHWLKGFGYQVAVMDLGHHDWGASKYVGDACQKQTWEQIKTKFDLIIIHDVLEHLPEDYLALTYARGVLKSDGYLLLGVPYHHDEEITHVRAYSKVTLKRLLDTAGYQIVWEQEKPGFFDAHHLVNTLNYGLALLMPTERLGARLLQSLLKVEYFVNERTRGLYRMLFRGSNQLGILLAAQPQAQPKNADYVQANKSRFVPPAQPVSDARAVSSLHPQP